MFNALLRFHKVFRAQSDITTIHKCNKCKYQIDVKESKLNTCSQCHLIFAAVDLK